MRKISASNIKSGGRAMGGPGGRPKLSFASFKRLIGYIGKYYKFQFSIVIISLILSAAITISTSIIMKPLVDDYIAPYIGMQNPDLTPLLTFILSLAALYVVGVVCSYLYNRLMINVSLGIIKRIRDEMFVHMQSLPLNYFDTHLNGDIMSVYTNDTDALRQMLGQSLVQLISSAVTVVGVFLAMCILNWFLTLMVVVVVIIMLVTVRKIGSRSASSFIKQQENIGQLNGFIEEMTEGQRVIKVFNHEEFAKEDFDKINEEVFESSYEANTMANILRPIMDNLSYVQYSLTAIVGAVLTANGTFGMTEGTLISFLLLARSFAQPISQISLQVNSIIMALAGAKRIFELLDSKSEVDEGFVTLTRACKNSAGELTEQCTQKDSDVWCWKLNDGSNKLVELKGDVRFYDVSFSYDNKKYALQGINLYAKPGQKIAFVGATGAGKTTITNLINRFYDIQNGRITYDGIDVKDIKKDDLRRSLGMVLQDTHLFTGTIKDNIRFGKLDATDEEVYHAAKLANADFFISHLPQGYDTVITGDGANLSQGQRQLLAIARAAIANPPVLILDEATSSIDTRTERLIEKSMDKLMEGRTVFVIAHRLSTVRNAQAIMVLENGGIIERGSHDDLLSQKGKYYQLYTGAFELS